MQGNSGEIPGTTRWDLPDDRGELLIEIGLDEVLPVDMTGGKMPTRAVDDTPPDFRWCMIPWIQIECAAFERGQIAAFQIRPHQIVAAHAERDYFRDVR